MRILIADDDVTSRLLLKAVAVKLGHECHVALDGASAWQMLSTQRFDVLLTDWMMPGLSGPELCRRVRTDLGASYVYIVLITGLGNPEQVLEGMSAGADDYLIKPVDPFAVQTRLVAATRVTALHHQVAHFRAQLEHANLELLGQSLTDALTGLGNRRRMDEDLASTHAHAVRTNQAYGIAMFDIDHFKLYNDRYGHLAGDDTLRRVARTLDGASRTAERVYRYGGEEFLLLLPDCTSAHTATAAERIRQAVNHAAIPHQSRPTPPALVTLSGGITTWTPDCGLTTADLVRQADQALFNAKAAGRDQIHTSPAHRTQHPQPSLHAN